MLFKFLERNECEFFSYGLWEKGEIQDFEGEKNGGTVK